MIHAIRLYLRLIGISLRGQMQYRASFWMLAAGYLLITGIEYIGIWALFDRFGSLEGWTLPEVALFYGIVNIAFSLAEISGRGFDSFSRMVIRGDFDRLLLRPCSATLQVAGQEVHLFRFGRTVQGMAALLWGSYMLGIDWTLPKFLLLLAASLGGACLFYGLLIIQATMCFWTVETLEIMNILTHGGTETGMYPLTIYRPWFRLFFTFVVPLACMNYLPISAILDRRDPFGAPTLFQWLAPLFGMLFLLASLQIWRIGVRRYCSTGN
jgi:ABC-2 type transport system permease protein